MEIYLVRHGQTGGNIAKRHQSEETHLTPLGKQQASQAAEKIASLHPTHLLVSDRVRAIETAQEIAQTVDLMPQVNGIFTELCRPGTVYGYHHRSLKSIWYIYQWYRGKVGIDSCSNEGESYNHFFQRIKAAQRLLESQPADARVVVVSHSIFINFFVAHLHSDTPMNFIRAALIFTKILRIKNGSITTLQYDASADPRHQWRLISFGE
jgi:broad specificity phosphatase PhoE